MEGVEKIASEQQAKLNTNTESEENKITSISKFKNRQPAQAKTERS